MTTPVGFDLNLDAQDYVNSVGMALAATQSLDSSMSKLSVTSAGANRALNQAGPSKATILGMGAFTAAAAAAQSQLSGFRATASITGQSTEKFAAGIRSMAREMPVSSRAIQQTVEVVSQLGIAGANSRKQIEDLARAQKSLGSSTGGREVSQMLSGARTTAFANRNSEQRTLQIAKLGIQAGAATGGDPNALAAGLVQLDRSFGNQNLDPKHLRSVSDSLVTVSKSAGVSAQGTLDFANSIAPMAKAAGVGEKAAVGISAAFNQIGQDGGAASTAVSKILSDMSRAARDGGPQMAIYGEIVGKTADQFQRLYQANPTEALTQVTEGLAKAGPRAPRMLESLGLEGVRTSRALTGLSGSGQLRDIISQTLNAGNNDATAKASKAAFNDVWSSFQRTANASQQLAEALGKPLLGPLGVFAATVQKVTAKASTGVGAVLGAGPGSFNVGNIAAITGIAALIGRKVFGFGQTAAMAYQASTSGVVRGVAGGLLVGRNGGDYEAARASGAMGRFATPTLNAAQAGAYSGPGFMNGLVRGAINIGTGVGTAFGPPGPPGRGLFGMLGNAVRYGGVGTAAYTRALGAQAAMAREPDPSRREAIMRDRMSFLPGQAGSVYGKQLSDAYERNFGPNKVAGGGAAAFGKEAMAASRDLNKAIKDNVSGFRAVGLSLKGFGLALRETTGFTASRGAALGVGALGAIGRGGASLMSSLGGPVGIGITAAAVGIPMWMQARDKAKQNRADQVQGWLNSPIDEVLNKYLEGIGKAGEGALTMAQQLKDSTRIVADSVTSFQSGPGSPGALQVSGNDIAIGTSSKAAVVQKFDKKANPDQIAAQLRLIAPPTGLTPELAQSFKIDLLRQFSPSFTQQVLGQLLPTGGTGLSPGGASINGGPGPVADTGITDIQKVIQGASAATVRRDKASDIPGSKAGTSSAYGTHLLGVGSSHLGQPAVDANKQVADSIATRFEDQRKDLGAGYAFQTRYQGINAALQTAADSGNEVEVRDLGKELASALPGVDPAKIPKVTAGDIKSAGGYIQALSAKSPEFAKAWKDQQGTLGISSDPNSPNLIPSTQKSETATAMAGNGLFGSLFDNTANMSIANNRTGPSGQGGAQMSQTDIATSGARKAMFDFLQHPDQIKNQAGLQDKSVQAAEAAGQSMADLSRQASDAANKLGGMGTAAGQAAELVVQAAHHQQELRNKVNPAGLDPGQSMNEQLQMNLSDLQLPDTPENKDRRDAAQNNTADLFANIREQLTQRLQAQRQYNIAVARQNQDFAEQQTYAKQDFERQQTRAQEDYSKQRLYAQQDFQRQSERAADDYHTQMARAQRDYNIQVQRSEEDYNVQRSRSQRDFNISLSRSNEDYLIQRGRSVRDFNKQIGREIKDQAQTLFDPYTRIKTQPIWDTNSLVGNIKDQNAAIKKQVGQLSQIRKLGVGNDAIQQLGLNDPKNAQQLNQMVNDLLSDPSLVRQINQTAAAQLSLGKLLVQDPANKQLQRAKEDFQTQLTDMQHDFTKSINRARSDFTKSMNDAAADFAKSMSRMNQDYQKGLGDAAVDFEKAMARSGEDFKTALSRMDDAYELSVQRSNEDFDRAMSRMADQQAKTLKRMKEDLIESQKVITGSITDLWNALQDTMHGKSDAVNKLMTDGLDATLKGIQSKQSDWNAAYKLLFPYDLKGWFGSNGGGPGGGGNPELGRQAATSAGPGGVWPILGGATDLHNFGQDRGDHVHAGIDLDAPAGTPIVAGMSGIVTRTGVMGGYGNAAVISFGGGRTALYGHMIAPAGVKVGQLVNSDTVIGNVGSTGNSTGNHLHLETRLNGAALNPDITWPLWKAQSGEGNFALHNGPGPWGALIGLADFLTELNQIMAATEGGAGYGSNVPEIADLKDYANRLLMEHGWPGQFNALNNIIMHESGWRVHARSGESDGPPDNRAYGIPQALPASKMASAGPDWADNGHTQLRWMMGYIRDVYHNPNHAWDMWQKNRSYGDGSIFNGTHDITIGERGPEAVIPLNNAGVQVLASAFSSVVKPDQLHEMVTSDKRSPVTYVSEITHVDKRTIFEGDISVESNDPNDMVRQLAARQRSSNLVKKRG